MITAFYAGLFGILFACLTALVIVRRMGLGISIGDGDDEVLAYRVRAHANFIEYAPICLLMIWMLEEQAPGTDLIHTLCLILLAGRLLHAYAFLFGQKVGMVRIIGMVFTIGVLISSSVSLAWNGYNSCVKPPLSTDDSKKIEAFIDMC